AELVRWPLPIFHRHFRTRTKMFTVAIVSITRAGSENVRHSLVHRSHGCDVMRMTGDNLQTGVSIPDKRCTAIHEHDSPIPTHVYSIRNKYRQRLALDRIDAVDIEPVEI